MLWCVCVYECACYSTLPSQAGCDTRSNFKAECVCMSICVHVCIRDCVCVCVYSLNCSISSQTQCKVVFLSRVKLVWIHFIFLDQLPLLRLRKPIFSTIYPKGTGGFMPFPRALAWSETQTALFELVWPIPFCTIITVVLSMPPYLRITKSKRRTCNLILDIDMFTCYGTVAVLLAMCH